MQIKLIILIFSLLCTTSISVGMEFGQCDEMVNKIDVNHQQFIKNLLPWMENFSNKTSVEELQNKIKKQLEEYLENFESDTAVTFLQNLILFGDAPDTRKLSIPELQAIQYLYPSILKNFSTEIKVKAVIPLIECGFSNETILNDLSSLYKIIVNVEEKEEIVYKKIITSDLDSSIALLKSMYQNGTNGTVLLRIMLESDEKNAIYLIYDSFPEFRKLMLIIMDDKGSEYNVNNEEDLKTLVRMTDMLKEGYPVRNYDELKHVLQCRRKSEDIRTEIVRLTKSNNEVIKSVALKLKEIIDIKDCCCVNAF